MNALTARLGAQWDPYGRFGLYLGGPGGHFGVHFGTYFGNFGACWAFGPPLGPVGFNSGVHGTLLDQLLVILASILDLFWIRFLDIFLDNFRDLVFESVSARFLGHFGLVLGPGGASKPWKNVKR